MVDLGFTHLLTRPPWQKLKDTIPVLNVEHYYIAMPLNAAIAKALFQYFESITYLMYLLTFSLFETIVYEILVSSSNLVTATIPLILKYE